RGPVSARMHVDDVGADRHVRGGRDVRARRRGEDAGAVKGEARAQDRVADRASEPEPGRDALARGAVQEFAGLARHPEGAALETGADVFGGAAVPGELEVVHQAGAV